MIPRRPAARVMQDAERGIRDLEGHLLWAAEIADALEAGEDFASRFDWAAADEREVLARVYAEQRLEDSRWMISRVARRARDLQAEYDHRWQQVTSRLVLGVLLALAAVIFSSALLYALR